MKNIKSLTVGRPVRVRFGIDWRSGVVASNRAEVVVVVVNGVPISIHSSVLRRDLRVA